MIWIKRAKCRTAWGTSPGRKLLGRLVLPLCASSDRKKKAAHSETAFPMFFKQRLVIHIAHATTMRHRRRGFRFWLLGDHGLGSNEEASH